METYAVTFFDSEGDWEDRVEGLDSYSQALTYAQGNTKEGGHSQVHKVTLCSTVRWTRKFKVT